MRRARIVAIGVAAGALLVQACASSTDPLVSVMSNPLPAAVQPPDPCSLLTSVEVSTATGREIASPGPSEPARGDTGERMCYWPASDAPADRLTIHLRTARGLAAMAALRNHAAGKAVYTPTIETEFTALLPKDAVKVPGLGMNAYVWQRPNLDRISCRVVGSGFLMELDAEHLLRDQSTPQLVSLARRAISRLSASP
jgi:hypothetical protein